MSIKGVLLDFNGTLFFDSHYHELAWKAISKELRGTAMSDEELRMHMHGKNNEKVIEYIMGATIDTKENKRYSLKKEAMYRDMCIAHPASFHLVDGAETFMDTLVKKHIPFTIASASIKENIDFFVKSFHLDTWLNPASIVYDDGTYATKVEMFQEAARRIHTDIQDCLVIEDSVSGIQFAHACGVGEIVAIQPVGKDVDFLKQFPYVKTILHDFKDFPWEFFM